MNRALLIVGILLLSGVIVAPANHAQMTQITPSVQNAMLEDANQLDQKALKYYQQGRYSEAIPLLEKSLRIRQNLLKPNHPIVQCH